jgi:hypothetical protein
VDQVVQRALEHARALAGERECPPDDVGGPGGYDALVAAVKNAPKSEEANRYVE